MSQAMARTLVKTSVVSSSSLDRSPRSSDTTRWFSLCLSSALASDTHGTHPLPLRALARLCQSICAILILTLTLEYFGRHILLFYNVLSCRFWPLSFHFALWVAFPHGNVVSSACSCQFVPVEMRIGCRRDVLGVVLPCPPERMYIRVETEDLLLVQACNRQSLSDFLF